MSTTVSHEPDAACADCGRFGAYVFADERLCLDCYQQRGSCGAEREACAEPAAGPAVPAAIRAGLASDETHRVNPNCCYSACPRCSSLRRLRAFQARHPDDWSARLRGLPRIVEAARERRL